MVPTTLRWLAQRVGGWGKVYVVEALCEVGAFRHRAATRPVPGLAGATGLGRGQPAGVSRFLAAPGDTPSTRLKARANAASER